MCALPEGVGMKVAVIVALPLAMAPALARPLPGPSELWALLICVGAACACLALAVIVVARVLRELDEAKRNLREEQRWGEHLLGSAYDFVISVQDGPEDNLVILKSCAELDAVAGQCMEGRSLQKAGVEEDATGRCEPLRAGALGGRRGWARASFLDAKGQSVDCSVGFVPQRQGQGSPGVQLGLSKAAPRRAAQKAEEAKKAPGNDDNLSSVETDVPSTCQALEVSPSAVGIPGVRPLRAKRCKKQPAVPPPGVEKILAEAARQVKAYHKAVKLQGAGVALETLVKGGVAQEAEEPEEPEEPKEPEEPEEPEEEAEEAKDFLEWSSDESVEDSDEEICIQLGLKKQPRVIALSQVQDLVVGALPSIGSAHHPGACFPCKYFGTARGCRDGKLCTDCHYMHLEVTHSERRRRARQRGKLRAELCAAAMNRAELEVRATGAGALRRASTYAAAQRLADTVADGGPAPRLLAVPRFAQQPGKRWFVEL